MTVVMSSDPAHEATPPESWDPENDKIFERLALNEQDSTPWPELRRLIRQRLKCAIADLLKSHSPSDNSTTDRKSPPSEAPQVEGEMEVCDAAASNRSADNPPADNDIVTSDSPEDSAMDETKSLTNGDRDHPTPAEDTNTSLSDDANNSGSLAEAASSPDDKDMLMRDIHDLEDRIWYCLHTFDDAPFTIQRIAELLADPCKHYTNVVKFLRAVERVVYVTSTVGEFPTVSAASPEQGKGDEGGSGESPSNNESSATTRPAPSPVLSFMPVQEVTAHTAIGKMTSITSITPVNAMSMSSPWGSSSKTAPAGERQNNSSESKRSPLMTAPAFQLPAVAGKGQRDAEALKPASPISPVVQGAIPGNPPLDASDTGILHITSSAAEGNGLKKIKATMDSSIPVYVDRPASDQEALAGMTVRPQLEPSSEEREKGEEK